ncbi:D(1A) dopamine receptor [Platysternon megacephalum]|uniref:D(1A) dopamine receptor n=1 Tax=Platysternon megacephalum TaxID=55544 RepID=A0A4D9ET81_9SAUR|nr:D(1A) dopamine receptor [Platysternon megacephalum]
MIIALVVVGYMCYTEWQCILQISLNMYVLKGQILINRFMCQQRCFICHIIITIYSKQAIQICTFFLYCTYWHHWSEMHIFTNRPVTDKFPAKELKSRNKICKTQCLCAVFFISFMNVNLQFNSTQQFLINWNLM